MSKAKRKRIEKEAAKQAAKAEETSNGWSYRRVVITVTIIFIALIAIIIGINHFLGEEQRYYRIDLISVDGDTIDMDYFLRRCFYSGADPLDALINITREMVIKKEAEAIGMKISEAAVEDRLIEIAAGSSENITQSEFKEWYRQNLNQAGLSDAEYRDIVATNIMAEFFYDAIVETMPTTAEQVHLHVIQTDTEESALEIRARWEAGEAFADLARELSLDTETGENGGDVGWIPRGVILDSWLDDTAFTLEIGVMSEPVDYYIVDETGESEYLIYYYLLMVSEKDDSHEIDEQYKDTLQGNAYEEWINDRMKEYDIESYGINGKFDSETYYWITWQLQKLAGED